MDIKHSFIIIIFLLNVCHECLAGPCDEGDLLPCWDPSKDQYDDGPDDAQDLSDRKAGEAKKLSGVTDLEVDQETLTSWVEEILNGVTYLKNLRTPGQVYAYGPQALPVLLGKTDVDSIVVAAELGQGRIIATGEEFYLKTVFEYDNGCKTTAQGLDYNGTVSITRRGTVCQRWDSQTPHRHNFDQDDHFPDATVADAANYCRNPDGSSQPWCQTTKPNKKRNYCNIPMCLTEDKTDELNLLQFHTNAKKWVSRGGYLGLQNMCIITDVSDMSCLANEEVKLALWSHTQDLATPESDAVMLEWVKAGGGLLYAITPWIWKSYTRKGVPFTGIPFYSVLNSAGIGLADKYASSEGGKYYADTSSSFISSLYEANIHYEAKTFTEIADMMNPSPYMTLMLKIINSDGDFRYSVHLRTGIAFPLVSFIHAVESEMTWPFNNKTSRPVDSAINNMLSLYTQMSYLGLWQTKKVPYVANFPGDAPGAPTESTILTVETDKRNFWSSGYYLLPGDDMTVEVLSLEDETWKSFSVVVGLHTDRLFGRSSLHRFPDVSREVPLGSSLIHVTSPFGGMVYLYSPASNRRMYISVNIAGVIKAPYYKLDDPQSMQEWRERRLAPAPWADIEGKEITFHLPSEGIRDLDDPGPVMRAWDNVVALDYVFASKPESEQRHQFFVPDVQITNGMLHAGYPIMAHIKSFGYPNMTSWPLHRDNFQNQWGLLHELGHNMQLGYWTFDGFTECTVNIFSMIQMEYAAKANPFDPHPEKDEGWYNKRIKEPQLGNVLRSGRYSILESTPWVALLSYAQLYEQFGWGCYQEVFAEYENDIANNNDALPETNTQEVEQWATRWSHTVGYDLCPFFELWGYPVEQICDQLTMYPPFLPTDRITNMTEAQVRLEEIISKYPGIHRTLPSKPPCYKPTYFHKQEMKAQILEQSQLLQEQIKLMKENVPIFDAEKHGMLGKIKDLREKHEKNNRMPMKQGQM